MPTPKYIRYAGSLYRIDSLPAPERIRVSGHVYRRLEEPVRTALLRGKKPVEEHNYPELEQGFLKVSKAIGGLTSRTQRELTTGRGREEAALVYIEGKLLNAQDQMMLAYEAILGL